MGLPSPICNQTIHHIDLQSTRAAHKYAPARPRSTQHEAQEIAEEETQVEEDTDGERAFVLHAPSPKARLRPASHACQACQHKYQFENPL